MDTKDELALDGGLKAQAATVSKKEPKCSRVKFLVITIQHQHHALGPLRVLQIIEAIERQVWQAPQQAMQSEVCAFIRKRVGVHARHAALSSCFIIL